MYSLKNIRMFKGHEGDPCAQGSLHGTKGKIADWADDTWSGDMTVSFINEEVRAKFVEWARSYLPQFKDFEDRPYAPQSMTPAQIEQTAVAQMSFEAIERKELEKAAKQGIAYYRKDPSIGEGKLLYVSKAPYTKENVEALRAKYADILEIVNERFHMPYVDGTIAAKAAEEKRFKQLCKSSILFTIRQPDASLKLLQVKLSYTSARAAYLRAETPSIVEIINERYIAPSAEKLAA